MTSPHHLHAVAAAWSLQAARDRLTTLAHAEARQNARGLVDAADGLRSTTYGQRHATGGHSDPVSGLLTAGTRPARQTWWADLLHRSNDRLGWLAGQLDHRSPSAAHGMDPIARVLAALPKLQTGTAAVAARHLDDEDQLVRGWVALPPACQPLPGIACPHCGERQLHVQIAGPVAAWTVVCATGRPCTGQGCPCGMPGAVEGAPHIWPRALVLGAVAGAAPQAQ